MRIRQLYITLGALAGMLICADQATKHWARLRLAPERHCAGVLLQIQHHNGFLYRLFQSGPIPVQKFFYVGVPTFALVLMLLILIKLQDEKFVTSLALVFVLAGAVGNLMDRFVYGYVNDFVGVSGFGVRTFLNLADLWIILGLVLLSWPLVHTRKD